MLSAGTWCRLLGLAILLLAGGLVGGCGPLVDQRAMQERATAPAEPLYRGKSLEQTFVAGRDRLAAVEVLAAVYPPGYGDERGELVLRLSEADSGIEVGTAAFPVDALRHNERYRLGFAPQSHSAGRTYRLSVESTTDSPSRATLWLAGDDAYTGGECAYDGKPLAGDLTFRAYYDYDVLWLPGDLTRALSRHGLALLVILAFLLLPGMAVQKSLLPGLALDTAESAGLWLGLSVALAPLLLYTVTLAGLRLGMEAVVVLLIACACLGLWRAWPGRRSLMGGRLSGGPLSLWRAALSPAAGVFCVAGGAVLLRFVNAQDLALPLWVDSVHHTLIARLIAETGQLPVDYGPLLPPQPMLYHFGFHTLVAFANWTTGLDVATGVLVVGQLLDGLVVFPVYLFSSQLSGDRRAGLAAAVSVGLVSTMPAYYVSWGRYPQLAGLLVLPVAALLTSRLLRRGATAKHEAGERLAWPRLLLAATIAVAGQVLVHPRVALLLGCWVIAELLVVLVSVRAERLQVRRTLATAGVLGCCASLLLLPWLTRLAGSLVAAELALPPTGDTVFPLGLLTGGGDRFLLAAAILGAGVGLARRRREALLLVLWVALCLLVANPYLAGLPFNPLLGNDALAIALFLPLALLGAVFVAEMLSLVRYGAWPKVPRLALSSGLLLSGALGAVDLVGIVNPSCILATAADVEAIRWVERYTPADATFLINPRYWQYGTYAGSDGGYWLLPLAGRRTSLPPTLYQHGPPKDAAHINRLAERLERQPPAEAGEVRRIMLEEGLTHVFIGALGGPLHYEVLVGDPRFRLLYSNGESWVFTLAGTSED